jgi:hypothetical protein
MKGASNVFNLRITICCDDESVKEVSDRYEALLRALAEGGVDGGKMFRKLRHGFANSRLKSNPGVHLVALIAWTR